MKPCQPLEMLITLDFGMLLEYFWTLLDNVSDTLFPWGLHWLHWLDRHFLLISLVLSKVASGSLDCQAENVAARLGWNCRGRLFRRSRRFVNPNMQLR